MKLETTNVFKHLADKATNLIVLNDEQLKKLQNVILEISDDIIGICEEEKINYHLTGGSALGAVRHNGFIPWDDDLDIDIARIDYNRFIEAVRKKYPDKYYIHYPYNTDGHSIPSIQIRLKNTKVRGCNDFDENQCGAYIDVAIIENTYDNKLRRKIHGIGSMGLGFIVSCRKFNKHRKYLLKLAEGDEEAIKIFKTKIFIGKLFSFLTLRRWTIIYDKWNRKCRKKTTKYVVVPTGRNHFFGEIYERNDFYEQKKHIFEGRNWNIPKESDKYLRHMYGDYMILPPKEKREKHALIEFDV